MLRIPWNEHANKDGVLEKMEILILNIRKKYLNNMKRGFGKYEAGRIY